jgi:hypothetical protein
MTWLSSINPKRKKQMSKKIINISGSKGGVGKSIISMCVIDYFESIEDSPILVESDTSNPDVWKAYKDRVKSELINLDDKDGWIKFINFCDSNKNSTIVINSAARSNDGVQAYGKMLNDNIDALGHKLVTLWVINRQRDSLELLADYMEAIPKAEIHVVRNTYIGDPSKFELYNSSNIKKTIEERGGKTIDFPDLADRVADEIYNERLPIAEAGEKMPLGNHAELARWRAEVKKVMEAIL